MNAANADPRHDAPVYSAERLAYFEDKMDEYSRLGLRHLVFTPPTDRGCLLTHCETWALNLQQDYVPTLHGQGRWPTVRAGIHPKVLTREQVTWLKRNWGDCARLWVENGCPRPSAVADLSEARKVAAKAEYANLVMKTFRDREHDDRRTYLERRAAVERAARQRL